MPEVRGAICHRFELPELSEGAKFPALNLRIQAPSTFLLRKAFGCENCPTPSTPSSCFPQLSPDQTSHRPEQTKVQECATSSGSPYPTGTLEPTRCLIGTLPIPRHGYLATREARTPSLPPALTQEA